jgi:hypothetical protein
MNATNATNLAKAQKLARMLRAGNYSKRQIERIVRDVARETGFSTADVRRVVALAKAVV